MELISTLARVLMKSDEAKSALPEKHLWDILWGGPGGGGGAGGNVRAEEKGRGGGESPQRILERLAAMHKAIATQTHWPMKPYEGRRAW